MSQILRALFVEDREDDAELVKLHLARAGWDVVPRRVETREEMVLALKGEAWDVVLADYSLPSFDASRALATMHENEIDVPLIVVSGTVGEARAVELMRLGARDFVLKDDLARLSPAIAREIREADNRQMRRNAERQREELIERLRRALDDAAHLNLSLQEVQRAKDQFLATVSHELRTPLTAILGWTRIIGSTTIDEARRAHALTVIERNARAMTQLVEDLLDFSGISRGQLRLNVGSVDVGQLVDETIESLRVVAQTKGIDIRWAGASGDAHMMGDETRLQQVVWNLLSNALKFTPKGGHVDVTVVHVESSLELLVSDTGQGITSDFLPFVFEPFRQADGTPTRAHGGLGLGLSIARHLVTLHGGRIRAESEGTGRGARFIVSLPMRAELADRK